MLSSESSVRLDLLRFPLIVGVVFIHASAIKVGFSGGSVGLAQPVFWVDFIRNFISLIASLSVPVFFLMSGYLFFMNFKFSKSSYILKLKKRLKTLLIPFLFWNLVAFTITVTAQLIPFTRQFFSGQHTLITSFHSIFDYLNAIVGFTGPPVAYQLWFIRDLMIVVLLVPFINLIIEYIPLPFLGGILALWIVDFWPVYLPSSTALLFFSIGAYMASEKKDIFCLDRFGRVITGLYFVILTIDVATMTQSPIPRLYQVGVLFGVMTVLFLTKMISRNEPLTLWILRLNSSSFFVYATHEPLLTILRKISYKVFSPDSPIAILSLYFSLPVIIIVSMVVVYRLLNAISPRLLGVVTGGR